MTAPFDPIPISRPVFVLRYNLVTNLSLAFSRPFGNVRQPSFVDLSRMAASEDWVEEVLLHRFFDPPEEIFA